MTVRHWAGTKISSCWVYAISRWRGIKQLARKIGGFWFSFVPYKSSWCSCSQQPATGEIPGPQPLEPVLSKGKLLNNNILILKTDSFKANDWKVLKYWTDCQTMYK